MIQAVESEQPEAQLEQIHFEGFAYMCAQFRLVPFLSSNSCLKTYRAELSSRETVESLRIYQELSLRWNNDRLLLLRVCGRPSSYASVIASFLAERSVA